MAPKRREDEMERWNIEGEGENRALGSRSTVRVFT